MADIKDTENTICYEIEGPEENNGHLELPEFSKRISLFHKLLSSSVRNGKHKDVGFRVVSLSHSSPTTITCQGIRRDNGQPDPAAVFDVKRILDGINKEETDDLDNECLSVMEKLTAPSPKIARHSLTIVGKNPDDGLVHEFDEGFREKLSRARDEEYAEISTVGGVLEAINIHRQPYAFNIYNTGLGPATIQCLFEDGLLGQVQDALGHDVYICGRCFYRPNKNIPYKITDIRRIEKLPPPGELPSLKDIKGIAPGLTGGKAPEDFVRELRGRWEKHR